MEHYQTELALVRTALWGAERFPMETDGTEDWESVFHELTDQAIAGITADAMGTIPGMDPGVKRMWIQSATRGLGFWNKLMREQDALKTLLDGAQIPFVVLKGAGAAMYYAQPECRSMGDVDLIVKPDDFDRANQLFLDHGYQWVEEKTDRHNSFEKNGIHFELHRYFSIFNDPQKSKALDTLIFAAMDRREFITLGQFTVPVLPKLENGLVLLAHIDQHMETGLGLRQIIDWMLYVDRNLDDDFWETEFAPRVQLLEKETLAVTVTRMCQLYLGLREDRIRWCQSANEKLCREIMEMTVSRGNFGRKIGKSATAISILNAMSDVANIPRLLQTRGCVNWKALKKYPFLRPFAWLYQICRYIRKVLSPQYSVGRLMKDAGQAEQVRTALDALGVRQAWKVMEAEKKKEDIMK